MINLNNQRPQQQEMSLEEKLMRLLSGSLPGIGTALGSFGGPAGAAAGGALGSLGGMGMNAFMPQQQQMQQQDQPFVLGGQGQGMQQMPMQQQQGMPGMEQFGMGLGQSMGGLGSQGIQGLLGMLVGQQQQAGMMGGMDDTLREKLARIIAMRTMMGGQ